MGAIKQAVLSGDGSSVWLNRLSLDAVLVAMVWCMAVAEAQNVLVGRVEVLLLGLFTWLAYTGDHLGDVWLGKATPTTGRHQWFFNNRRRLAVIWFVVAILVTLAALVVLPMWKFLWGLLLAAAVIAYFGIVRLPLSHVFLMFLKRGCVAALFAGGIVWMAEAWRQTVGMLVVLAFLLAALANLFLHSVWENPDPQNGRLARRVWFFVLGVMGVVALLYPAEMMPVRIALLVGGLQLFALGYLPATIGEERRRFLADLILVVMAMLILGMA